MTDDQWILETYRNDIYNHDDEPLQGHVLTDAGAPGNETLGQSPKGACHVGGSTSASRGGLDDMDPVETTLKQLENDPGRVR